MTAPLRLRAPAGRALTASTAIAALLFCGLAPVEPEPVVAMPLAAAPAESTKFDLLAALQAAPELAGYTIDVSGVKLAVENVTQTSSSFVEASSADFYKRTEGHNDLSTPQYINSPSELKTDTVSYTLSNSHSIGGGIEVESKWEANILFGSTQQGVKVSARYEYSWASSTTKLTTETVNFSAQAMQLLPGEAGVIEEYYNRGTLTADLAVTGRLSGFVSLSQCGRTLTVPVGQLLGARRDPGLGPIAPGWITAAGDDAVVNTTSTFVGQALLAYVHMRKLTTTGSIEEATTPVDMLNPLAQPVDSANDGPADLGTEGAQSGVPQPSASDDTTSGAAAASVGAGPSPSTEARPHLRDFRVCLPVSRSMNGKTWSLAEPLPDSSARILGGVHGNVGGSDMVNMYGYVLSGTDLIVQQFQPVRQYDKHILNAPQVMSKDVTSARVVVLFNRPKTPDDGNDTMQVDYIASGALFTGMARWGLSTTRVARGSATFGPTAVALGNGYVLEKGTLTYEGRTVARAVTDAFAHFTDDGSPRDTVYFVSGVRGYSAIGTTVVADPRLDVRYSSHARVVGPGYVLDRGTLYYRGARLTPAPGTQNPVVSAVGWMAFGTPNSSRGPYQAYAAAITAQGDYLDLKEGEVRRSVAGAVPGTARALPGGYVYTRGALLTETLTSIATGIRWQPACTVSPRQEGKGVTCLYTPGLGDVEDPALPEDTSRPITISYANGTSQTRIATVSVNGDARPIAFPPTGSWSTTSTVTATFDLRDDVNEISFTSAQWAPAIDKVEVAGVSYEAESAYNRTEGTSMRFVSGASGSIAVDGIGARGGSLSMVIDPGAAHVPVTFAYSSPRVWSRAQITIAGMTQTVLFPPTVDSNEIRTVTVELPVLAAANTLSVSAASGASPSIDSLTIGTTVLEAEEASTARGSQITLVTTSGAHPAVLAGSLGTSRERTLQFAYDPAQPADSVLSISYANPTTSVRSALISVNGYEQLVAFAPTGAGVSTLSVPMPLTGRSVTVGVRNPTGWAPLIDAVALDGVTAEAELQRNTIVAPAMTKLLAAASGGVVVGNIGMGKGELRIVVRR